MARLGQVQGLEIAMLSDNAFEVSWIGMDSVDYTDPKPTLQEAQKHAVMLSEHGAHTITITDVDGCEYGF